MTETKKTTVQKDPSMRLKYKYLEEVAPALMKEYNYKSTMETPKVEKEVKVEKKETPKPEEKNYMPIYSQEELDALDAEEEEDEYDSYDDYEEYDDDSYYE